MQKKFIHAALVAAVLMSVGLVVSNAQAQRSIPVDRVVAVVNDEVITAQELGQRVEHALAQLQQREVELPPVEALEEQVLERLILERAQIQRARELGISVDEATLERAIDRVARNNDLSREQLQETLRADGISWSRFREEVRTELLISRLREQQVEVNVTEAEIDNFIENNPQAFSGRQALVAHVLIRVSESAGDAEVERLRARAEEVLERFRSGEDFARLAAEYSDAPDAVEGGILGWSTPDELPGLFAEVIRDMQPGEVSDVLRSPAGFHIVFFADARGGELAAPEQMEQTRARHILVRPTEVLPDEEVEARLRGLRERIVQGGESFEELARVHSEDGAGARGGDLGWVNPGDTVPEFERAMNALAPGEVSEPVQTPFGWHLIKVEDRRVEEFSDERMRTRVRNVLRQRKAEEAYESWLSELRDSTYIENRLQRERELYR